MGFKGQLRVQEGALRIKLLKGELLLKINDPHQNSKARQSTAWLGIWNLTIVDIIARTNIPFDYTETLSSLTFQLNVLNLENIFAESNNSFLSNGDEHRFDSPYGYDENSFHHQQINCNCIIILCMIPRGLTSWLKYKVYFNSVNPIVA